MRLLPLIVCQFHPSLDFHDRVRHEAVVYHRDIRPSTQQSFIVGWRNGAVNFRQMMRDDEFGRERRDLFDGKIWPLFSISAELKVQT